MSHDITHEHTPRGRQLIAALALAHLLEQDLPMATWHIDAIAPVEMDGQISRHSIGTDHEPDLRRAVDAWAEFLRGEVVTRAYLSQPDVGVISVTGTHRGVRVTVWAQVSVPAAERTEAAS